MIIGLIRLMLYGPKPYLGCLSNRELEEELKWLKRREYS
jgi:hypothetical protein